MIIGGASQYDDCGGYDELIKACLHLPKLEYLDVSNNYEDMGQCPVLARLIRNHGNLKTIVMGGNELGQDQEQFVVEAIRDAAKANKLVLEDLDGLNLKESHWREILGIQDCEECSLMSNKEILSYLKSM